MLHISSWNLFLANYLVELELMYGLLVHVEHIFKRIPNGLKFSFFVGAIKD